MLLRLEALSRMRGRAQSHSGHQTLNFVQKFNSLSVNLECDEGCLCWHVIIIFIARRLCRARQILLQQLCPSITRWFCIIANEPIIKQSTMCLAKYSSFFTTKDFGEVLVGSPNCGAKYRWSRRFSPHVGQRVEKTNIKPWFHVKIKLL